MASLEKFSPTFHEQLSVNLSGDATDTGVATSEVLPYMVSIAYGALIATFAVIIVIKLIELFRR